MKLRHVRSGAATLVREAFSLKALAVVALQAALSAIITAVLNVVTDLPFGSIALIGVAGFLALAGCTLLWLHRHPDVLEAHDPRSLGMQCQAYADELEAFVDSRRLGEPATRTTLFVFGAFRRTQSPWPSDDGGFRALRTYRAATLGAYHAEFRVRGQRLFDRVEAPAAIHPDERRLLAQPASPEDMAAIAERFRGYALKLDGQATGPRLAFLLPSVSEGKHFNDLLFGTWAGHVVVFHVVNDGREVARKVWAEMRVLSPDGGEVLRQSVRARFPNDTPHPAPGVPSIDIDIPGNGRPHAIDSVVQAVDEFDSCWVVTDEGLRGNLRDPRWAVEQGSFVVEMTVHGENTPPIVQRIAVDLGFPTPRIVISSLVPAESNSAAAAVEDA